MRNEKYKLYLVGFLFFLLFLSIIGIIWIYTAIPDEAEKMFGPANEDFSINERFTYASRMMFLGDDLLAPETQPKIVIYFTVNSGEGIDSIANRLEEENLIRKAEVFKLYLIYSGLDRYIKAGEHQIKPGLDTIQIVKLLINNRSDEVKFNILAGWRLEEIADVLPTSGLSITSQQFLEKTRSTNWVVMPEDYTDFNSFEGLMMPGSYNVKRDIDVSGLLTLFLQSFNQKVTQDIKTGFKQQGLTIREGVILASVVEREAMVDEEKPLIASVFLNRLKDGIKLESDPTVQYAVGYVQDINTWWKNPLTAEDLEINSPYNSYAKPGLPPGPICSPGIKALQAVANPASTDYYFFRARCDQSGYHEFSKTYEEHVEKSCP